MNPELTLLSDRRAMIRLGAKTYYVHMRSPDVFAVTLNDEKPIVVLDCPDFLTALDRALHVYPAVSNSTFIPNFGPIRYAPRTP